MPLVSRPRHAAPGPPRTALPALLLGAGALALGGLATAPGSAGHEQRRTAAVAQPSPAGPAEPATERPLRRASRDRAPREGPVAATAASKPTAPAAPAAATKPATPPRPEPPAAAARRTAAAAARAEAAKPPEPARAKAAAPAEPKTAPVKRKRVAPVAAARSGGRCPVPSASFTDTYGAPRPGGRSHQGTDLMAAHGAPVYAVASGVVDVTSSRSGGLSLYLRSGNGERYFYAHHSANLVRDGQRVAGGDLIARVGNTGNARGTDPHVHFERQIGGRSVNPYDFLRRLCG